MMVGARGEGVEAEVDGVRAGLKGGERRLEGAGRGEKFNVVHDGWYFTTFLSSVSHFLLVSAAKMRYHTRVPRRKTDK